MFPPRKVLVPTDFSPSAAEALDHAAELAKKLDAEIVLLHVLQPLTTHLSVPPLVPLPPEWVKSVRMQAEAELKKESHRIKQVKVTTELRDGPIHDTVLAAASELKADLIVIGTHGRRGLSHVLLGSVAERVVRHSTVPVLTMRAGKGA